MDQSRPPVQTPRRRTWNSANVASHRRAPKEAFPAIAGSVSPIRQTVPLPKSGSVTYGFRGLCTLGSGIYGFRGLCALGSGSYCFRGLCVL